MKNNDDWAIGTNWLYIIIFGLSIISALFLSNSKDYRKLKTQCDVMWSEMTPYQRKNANNYINEYYDAKTFGL